MVAITLEKCAAQYLLVKMNDMKEKGKFHTNLGTMFYKILISKNDYDYDLSIPLYLISRISFSSCE